MEVDHLLGVLNHAPWMRYNQVTQNILLVTYQMQEDWSSLLYEYNGFMWSWDFDCLDSCVPFFFPLFVMPFYSDSSRESERTGDVYSSIPFMFFFAFWRTVHLENERCSRTLTLSVIWIHLSIYLGPYVGHTVLKRPLQRGFKLYWKHKMQ